MKRGPRHKTKFFINLILLLSAFPFYVCSQSLSDTIHIQEVTIVKKEIADEKVFIQSKLDSFAMTGTQSLSLSELLNKYSTVYIKSTGRGTLSTASIRGTGASHTKVLWNGMMINSPMLGQVDLSLIPVCFLDDISLFSGGSSLIQGSGALGGIIYLENKPDWNKKTGLSLRSEFASFRTYNLSGKFHFHKNKMISSSRVYHNHSVNDYPYLNTHVKPHEIEKLKNGDYTKSGILQEIYFRITNNDLLMVRFFLQNAGRNLPQPMSYEGITRNEQQKDRNLYTHLTWKHYGRFGQYEMNSAWIENKIEYQLKLSERDPANINSNSYEKGLMNRFNYLRQLGSKTDFRTQIYFNQYHVGIKEELRSEGYHAWRSDLSLMMGIQHNISDRIHTYFLIRNDLTDFKRIPVMPSAGIAIRALRNTELWMKTNFSRNYRYPGLNELYWIPGGNANLKPEENYSAEINADLTLQNDFFSFKTTLTGYISRIDDWIQWKPTQYGFWSPDNIALVMSRGLEFNLKSTVSLNGGNIIFQGNYNLCKTTNESAVLSVDRSEGKQLIYIPVHSANLHFGASYYGFYMIYSINLTGKRYTQTSNIESSSATTLNPYLLNDLFLRKKIMMKNVNSLIQIGVYNIFNTDYQVILSRPMPGRNYSLIFELSF